MGLGPFDLEGGPFLTLYGVLLVLACIASLVIPGRTRPSGWSGLSAGIDELAYLAGGTARMAESALIRLRTSKALLQVGKDSFNAVRLDGGETQVERSILGMARPARWSEILRHLKDYGKSIDARLARQGLLMNDGEALQQRLVQTAPLLMLLALGGTKLLVGLSRERPIGYLTAFLVATAVLALIRFFTLDRATRAGQALLAQERERAERLRRAPTNDELGTSVALFGTSVLVGSAYADFHRMRRDASGGGDGGSSSDGDGGGCGGGGCGGCGG